MSMPDPHPLPDGNLDPATVQGFGQEWARFDQHAADPAELAHLFGQYFSLFPWAQLPAGAEGFDLGCGSGRWAVHAAPRVGRLHCIDAAAQALQVARRNLAGQDNCVFHEASVAAIPLADASQDFGYSLGVLHHVPDTAAGIAACVRKLKPGAPFLVYLYYAFDNRPAWFRALWRASDLLRRGIARLPFGLRGRVTDLLALVLYLPLARSAWLLEKAGLAVESFPLSAYRHRSFYVMRTDALDRFGTALEQRFTRAQILRMMEAAGLERVAFRDAVPCWCAIGYRRAA